MYLFLGNSNVMSFFSLRPSHVPQVISEFSIYCLKVILIKSQITLCPDTHVAPHGHLCHKHQWLQRDCFSFRQHCDPQVTSTPTPRWPPGTLVPVPHRTNGTIFLPCAKIYLWFRNNRNIAGRLIYNFYSKSLLLEPMHSKLTLLPAQDGFFPSFWNVFNGRNQIITINYLIPPLPRLQAHLDPNTGSPYFPSV